MYTLKTKISIVNKKKKNMILIKIWEKIIKDINKTHYKRHCNIVKDAIVINAVIINVIVINLKEAVPCIHHICNWFQHPPF